MTDNPASHRNSDGPEWKGMEPYLSTANRGSCYNYLPLHTLHTLHTLHSLLEE